MEKFIPFELLTEQTLPRAAEGEVAFEAATHALAQAASLQSVHSFEWKPGFRVESGVPSL